ncbi:MAG: hypothetical protein E6265_14085 [Enterobacteriaceae bacterium]|nr:hypothetical protein [Enterobacteriaceae bacterium]
MNQELLSTASNYCEACDLLRSGFVKHVRLNWNIGSDEFFRIATDWCDAGAKIKKEGDSFVISIKGFPIPRQQ